MNIKCQKFQRSTFITFVQLKASIIKFIPIASINIHTTRGVAKDIAASTGHPTSIVVRLRLKFSDIFWVAVPRLETIIPITRFIPINPIPIVKPDLKASFGFNLNINPKIKMIIGKTTTAPISSNACIIFISPSSFYIYFFIASTISSKVFFIPTPVKNGTPEKTGQSNF